MGDLCRRDSGLLEGSAGFCAERSRCLCEPFVCRCSPNFVIPLESGSNREIGPPPKGLNSPPPKGLTPKGLPLRHRTGAKGLVRSGCRRFPRRVLLGSWASGIRGSRKPGCLRPHTYTVPGRIGRQKGPGACGPGPSFFLWALADGSTRALRKDLGLMYPLRCCPTLFYLWC